ncbi:MAG: hypothetical protein U0271_13010 [Polyangiaceae bacterium]
MRCNACKIDFPDDGRFCPECGAVIIGPKLTVPGVPLEDSMAVPEPEPPAPTLAEPESPRSLVLLFGRGLLSLTMSAAAIAALNLVYPRFSGWLRSLVEAWIAGKDHEYARAFSGIVVAALATLLVSTMVLTLTRKQRG